MKKSVVFEEREYFATLRRDSWGVVDKYGTVPPVSVLQKLFRELGNPQNAEADAILDELEKRDVRHLCHFTRVQNIDSILERGILPRGHLERRGIPFQYSDKSRMDKRLSYSSLSISRPNLSMMLKKITNRGRLDSWVVFQIKREILTRTGTLFFPWNAASNRYVQEPDKLFLGYDAFIEAIPPIGTEFEQEEVMVPFKICPDDLLGIVVPYCPTSGHYEFGERLIKQGKKYRLTVPGQPPLPIWRSRFPYFPPNYP